MFDPIDVMAANSFRNFHVDGLSYLCLKRTPFFTMKAYFYEGQVNPLSPEIICPHDHRYPFSTTVIAGSCGHRRYRRSMHGYQYSEFTWLTPLNGGDGFKYKGQARLEVSAAEDWSAGETYLCQAEEIHTIAPSKNAILLLCQFNDAINVGAPTSTFVPGVESDAPRIDGNYEAMSEYDAEKYLAIVNRHMLNV